MNISKEKIYYLGFAFFSVLLVSFVVFLITNKIETDENGCMIEEYPKTHSLIFVDQSDPFTNMQIERLNSRIKSEVRNLKQYDKLSVVSVDPKNPYELKIWYSSCLPAFKAGFFDNSKKISAVSHRKLKELEEKLSNILQKNQSETSSIVENIAFAIRKYDFIKGQAEHRKLIIISDMLQHSENFSFLSRNSSSENFTNIANKRFRNGLEGLEIEVNIISRENHRVYAKAQERAFNYWSEYLKSLPIKNIEYFYW